MDSAKDMRGHSGCRTNTHWSRFTGLKSDPWVSVVHALVVDGVAEVCEHSEDVPVVLGCLEGLLKKQMREGSEAGLCG